ncbi:MAG: hypothetical protein V1915_03135 [Candidatus Bathyarchaeota archaeon]
MAKVICIIVPTELPNKLKELSTQEHLSISKLIELSINTAQETQTSDQ